MIGLQKLELVFGHKEYRQTDRGLRGQTGIEVDLVKDNKI